MNNKLNTDSLEELIREILDAHEEAWNEQSDKFELTYSMTLTFHKVPFESMEQQGEKTTKLNTDVAYLRLHRHLKPIGGTDDDTDTMLMYHQAHTFSSIVERLNEKAPWKKGLYLDLLAKMMIAGLEYSELLWRMKNQIKMEGQVNPPVSPGTEGKPDIIITDQMPESLPGDEEYKQWAKKHHEG